VLTTVQRNSRQAETECLGDTVTQHRSPHLNAIRCSADPTITVVPDSDSPRNIQFDKPARRRWPILLLGAVLIALTAAAAVWYLVGPIDSHSSHQSSTAAPSTTTTSPEPKDEYVAIAISPPTRDSSYGGSSTQERADKIATSQCIASTKDDLCLVVARMHHGCAAIAVSDAGEWATGTAPDETAAKMQALDRLPGTPHAAVARCSQ
jgi:hypothetical protein